jgi:hypothetical protein
MKILTIAATALLISASLSAPSGASAGTGLPQAAAGTAVPWGQTTRTPPPATAQAAPAPAAAVTGGAAPLDLDIPQVSGTAGDPTCGGRAAIAQRAFCVQTTQASMQTVADQYDVAFQQQGWHAAGGENNLTIYVKRKEGGGCTGFQLLAFADENRPVAPASPGYFAFATIPGDVCAARPAAAAPAQ